MSLRRTAGLVVLVLMFGSLSIGPAHAADAEVDMPGFVFEPERVAIDVGDSVTWTNSHNEPHTVTANDRSFDYWLDPGDTVTHTFTEEAYEPYFCELHGAPGLGMHGDVLVGDVEPPPPPDVTPLRAIDNVSAAIAWSQRNFPGGADVALLGRHDLFADSLSSGGAQGALGAPLLLTPSDNLNARTRSELRRLGVRQVILFGGTAALGPQVVEALRAEGYEVQRMRGSTRVGTAVNAATRIFPEADSVVLARAFGDAGDPSRAFADSLPAGALAAMTGRPVVLTTTESLSPETRAYIEERGIGHATIVGGVGAVSEEVEAELESLGVEVERHAGRNRYKTAQLIAWENPRAVVTVVPGHDPNAWASGFPAASAGFPVVLTAGNEVPEETLGVLVALGSEGAQALCAPFLAENLCSRARIAASARPLIGPEARLFVPEGRHETQGGDADATAFGGVLPTDDARTLCYDYEIYGLDEEPTGAHIHRAAAGTDGPIVVPLSVDSGANPFGSPGAVSCAFDLDANLARDILDNPSRYYVNIHTETYPAGAIRGQLFVSDGFLAAGLDGEQVAGGGDEEGFGFAGAVLPAGANEICAITFLVVSDAVTEARIHYGAEGQEGPAVATLRDPVVPFGGPAGCYAVSAEARRDLAANPAGFHVVVATEAFPEGAIRGQFGRQG